MARPTQTRINTAPGFTPESRQSPSLQVVAPLNVSAAPSSAELLANSLGVALDTAAPILQNRIKEQAADSTALGRSAATLNKVDAKRQAEDASYAVGVKRGMVDRAIVDFKSMAKTFYETQFDKSQGTEVLAQELDNIAKGSLQNYTADPDAVRWMTPEVANTVAQLTGVHDAELAQQFKDDRVATASAIMRDALQTGTPIDPEEIMNRLRPILGNSDATAAYVEMVGTMAVENRSPEMIEALIPDKWADGTPGPRSTPALNQALNQSRYYAQAAAREHEGELSDAAEARADALKFEAMRAAIRGIDPTILLEQARDVGLPIKSSDLSAITNAFRSSRDDEREQRLDPVRISQFRAGLIDNPDQFTTGDVVSFIGSNFAQGKDGVFQANALMDDYVTAQNAADRVSKNPLAKSYKENLVKRFGPAPWEKFEPEALDRYWQGMVAFDKALIETDDADKALAAAENYFGKTPTVEIKPRNDVVSDARAFAEGRINQAQFVAAHKRDGSAASIYGQIGKTLTREQAEKAIRALAGSPQ